MHDFLRGEALTRARHEYGLHPYEPELPCKILGSGVHYRCECGYTTTAASEIYEHCMSSDCSSNIADGETQMQLSLFDAA